MHSSKCTSFWINYQDRNTVSSLHAREHSSYITYNRITLAHVAAFIRCRLSFGSTFDNADIGPMNLPAACEHPITRKKLEKATTILQNVLRFVVIESGETQRVLWHVANTTESS